MRHRCRRLTSTVAWGFVRCIPEAESDDDAMGRVPVPRACVLSFAGGDLQLAGADFGHFRVRGAGQFTGVHGRIGVRLR
jgi:hypothetical protein